MKKRKMNLQLFAEGGSSAGASVSGAEGAAVSGVADPKGGSEDKSTVIYGKSEKSVAGSNKEETAKTPEVLHQEFEDLIKGEYKDEYSKRVQRTVEDRLKRSKEMEATLKSQQAILDRLADKYGADAKDPKSILKALEDDASFWEQEALKRGLSVEEFKRIKAIERENEKLREAQEELARKENSEKIYSEWIKQAQDMAAKYGIEGFSLEEEVKNENFTRLLAGGLDVETAYKACHFDEMMSGAMAFTAKKAEQKVVEGIKARSGRPQENGVTPQSTVTFKTDPSKFDDADIEEVKARVRRGEKIAF